MEEKHITQESLNRSRLRMRTAVGEIVEVQGGHIVRATGRKDRHSKVCTAKGPRDRRVRLAAHTAIQFYDVQDRLGYDRPSKAVDWLIKKAKSAIDELAELPPWNPETMVKVRNQNQKDYQFEIRDEGENLMAAASEVQNFGIAENSSFFQPSLDSDAIDDMKTFFPMAETPSSSIQFESFSPDLLSITSSQSQDLRLSLQSFQEPVQTQQSEPMMFSGTAGYGGSSTWENYQNPDDITRFQRMVAWISTSTETGSSSGGGLFINSPPQQPYSGHHSNQLFSQRGPLQSSNTPFIRAWIDDPITSTDDHLQYPISSSSGFSGFRIPARIQGDEEEHEDGSIFYKPSSASSHTRY